MKLCKQEYATVIYRYEWDFTPADLEELKEYLRRHLDDNQILPTITMQDIADIYKYDERPEMQVVMMWYNKYYKDNHYQNKLCDEIRDYLNDEVWESFVEDENIQTDDIEDYVEFDYGQNYAEELSWYNAQQINRDYPDEPEPEAPYYDADEEDDECEYRADTNE